MPFILPCCLPEPAQQKQTLNGPWINVACKLHASWKQKKKQWCRKKVGRVERQSKGIGNPVAVIFVVPVSAN